MCARMCVPCVCVSYRDGVEIELRSERLLRCEDSVVLSLAVEPRVEERVLGQLVGLDEGLLLGGRGHALERLALVVELEVLHELASLHVRVASAEGERHVDAGNLLLLSGRVGVLLLDLKEKKKKKKTVNETRNSTELRHCVVGPSLGVPLRPSNLFLP